MTVLTLRPAFVSMAKSAVTVLSLTTVRPLALPLPPEIEINEVPVRFVSVKVTGTVVPCQPDAAVIADRDGAASCASASPSQHVAVPPVFPWGFPR